MKAGVPLPNTVGIAAVSVYGCPGYYTVDSNGQVSALRLGGPYGGLDGGVGPGAIQATARAAVGRVARLCSGLALDLAASASAISLESVRTFRLLRDTHCRGERRHEGATCRCLRLPTR